MSIETDLYNRLKNDTEVNSLVSGRVYPLKKPQNGGTPYIIYSVVNNSDNTCMQGSKYSQDVRIQIDSYSNSYSSNKAIETAVKDALYNFDYPINSLSSRDMYEDDTELYRQLIDFKIKG